MKISKVNSNYPSFGYNPQYHKKVQNFLKKRVGKDKIANYLLAQDKLALQVEDDVVELEKNKKTRSKKYQDLYKYLIEIKRLLVYYFEYYYPNLKYCDSEIVQYIYEDMQSNSHRPGWKKEMIENLSLFSIKDYQTFYEE